MSEARRIVVLGALAQMPFAGVAWQVLHYLEGLRRLGHDVTYLEDTGNWPYDPDLETITDDATGAAARLGTVLAAHGFGERWAFVNAAREGEIHGPLAARLDGLLAEADVLLNLSGATILHDAHLDVPVRIYLETDPVTPQLELDQGRGSTRDILAAHTHHFTFGERIGTDGCEIPTGGFDYRPTRQPVVLDWWRPDGLPGGASGRASAKGAIADPDGFRFTTIASWDQPHKDIEWRGETYRWSKSAEFEKLLGVPARVGASIELALALDDGATLARLRAAGFRVRPARDLSGDHEAYRAFIRASGGEFTAAKDQNVRLRSGWFSDRTATYLAAGRPVVVQDTGFDAVLPTGEGLLSFRTADEAVAALEDVAGDPARHGAAALAIAREYFDAGVVLGRLLQDAGV
ncbi:glycosyltransferase [Paraconexibacter antarcticus]|uniref:Glycosyltransferase n=1 Tax=Paraconexibacter antarcticus TaxID=2949664 RepID=A0ABY5E0G5_9ACTN|nr:glycosyltransferase [Paraconexibacter antarcticus]UTI66647.1 glycosyltransferase [Paraconexibacter antarcticus]